MDKCDCVMYAHKGICWHTGFRGMNLPPEAYRKVEVTETMPAAIIRMRAYLRYCDELQLDRKEAKDV